MMQRILIFGSGDCAHQIATDLLADGNHVIVATPTDGAEYDCTANGVELYPHSKITGLKGVAGDYHARLTSIPEATKNHRHVHANAIVLSEEYDHTANFLPGGLIGHADMTTIGDLSNRLRKNQGSVSSESTEKHIAIVTGLWSESNPVTWETVLETALSIHSSRLEQAYVFLRHLKVSHTGLEALTREAKEAGVVMIKFHRTLPEFYETETGKLTIAYEDEVTRQSYTMVPDLVAVDETLKPADGLNELAAVCGLHTDGIGFLQSDNVHRLSVGTNRKGIWVAGPARRIQNRSRQMMDAAAVVVELRTQPTRSHLPSPIPAEIDTDQCVRCLTCYRLCPYRAIRLGREITVATDICEGCGICAAECPRGAIALDQAGGTTGSSSAIMVYACSRSAMPAGKTAACIQKELPGSVDIIPVPCAGSVSVEHLLSAFAGGVAGVLVLTCHEGNCHSEHGCRHARSRVARVSQLLDRIGLDGDRLQVESLAANQAVEYAAVINRFDRNINELGPSPLRQPRKLEQSRDGQTKP